MIRHIDDFIDRTTMYRLVLYYLAVLLGLAVVLAPFGLVPVDATQLVFSAVVAMAMCWTVNRIFAAVFETPANTESALITALIIALIMQPVAANDAAGLGGIVCASVWAIAAKFILAVRRKHVFNPAAIGVVLTGVLLAQPPTWWVAGDPVLLPAVLIGGVMVTRKLQRFDLVAMFIAANLLAVAATTPLADLQQAMVETLIHSPLFFLAFAMLTEPLTAPQARWPRLAYAAIVGVLAAPGIHLGSFFLTPELALLVGNAFAWLASPKGRYLLTLQRIEHAANGAYDFVFRPDRPIAFRPGQYLEWTLGVPHTDNRGNRRSFTIASAPTEDDVRLGVKFYPRASAFKRSLAQMQPGDTILASQLAGSFVLPRDPRTKLAFIAGGIGITPFRSMLRYLSDTGETRDIVMLYGNAELDDIAYRDVLNEAERSLGLRTVHVVERGDLSIPGLVPGLIDAELIALEVPDFMERVFYLSGPHAMVSAVSHALRSMGVPRRRIRTDFFPGLA
ncbi:MAG TPA: RnfABCDGE type electron transport complex subunit D [Devosia sp.]|nr:RnfABCDGE type electron transport complex subunit D [Devosia sp.]